LNDDFNDGCESISFKRFIAQFIYAIVTLSLGSALNECISVIDAIHLKANPGSWLSWI
jgi:hypothetical protein